MEITGNNSCNTDWHSCCKIYKTSKMAYFKQLISQAASDTWGFVLDSTLRSVLVGLAIFAITLGIHWWRKGIEDMKDVLFGGLEGAVATLFLLAAVFVFRFLFFTPKSFYEGEKEARIGLESAHEARKSLLTTAISDAKQIGDKLEESVKEKDKNLS